MAEDAYYVGGVKSSTACLLLLTALWPVVVDCQPQAPYVSFMGDNLPNHAFVDIDQIGEDSASLECHTDLATCCSNSFHRGGWVFPNGTTLPFRYQNDAIYMQRFNRRVHLSRTQAAAPSGIYTCQIPTVAVHREDASWPRASVYVGLYPSSGGNLSVRLEFNVDSDLNGASPQYTLTCISTGGPATNVSWARYYVTVTNGTESVLVDPVTAQYNHTLTVTRRIGGYYICSVSNSKPSNVWVGYEVIVPSTPFPVMVVQEGFTSIRVSWLPQPPSFPQATAFRIDYDGGSNGSITIAHNDYQGCLLTGLLEGENYTVTVVGLSEHFFSSAEPVRVNLERLSVSVDATSAHSLNISWTLPDSFTARTYTISYSNTNCPTDTYHDITRYATNAQYQLTGLQEGTDYSITVSATLTSGETGANTIRETTMEAAPSAPPTSVSVAKVTYSSITVQWGPVDCIHRNGGIRGYSVRLSEVVGEIFIDVSGEKNTRVTISGLVPSTDYNIQIAAVNSAGIGSYSTPIQADTNEALSLSVGYQSSTSLTLSWRLVDDGLITTNYTISYSNTNCTDDTYSDVTGIAGSETEYTLTGLQEGTHYFVTLTATLSGGETVEIRNVFSTVSTAPSAAPSSVTVSDYTSYSIIVQWGPVDCIHRNGHITGYSLQYIELGTGTTRTKSIVKSSATNDTFNVSASTNYSIQVAAVNSNGTGVYSHPITVKTHESVYISLNGEVIPNHGYVLINSIGTTGRDGLICNTNLPKLPQSYHSGGDWRAPDGTRVNADVVPGFRRDRAARMVRLFRDTDTAPGAVGIYKCSINDAEFVTRRDVYIGLYRNSEGYVTISDGVTLIVDSDLNGASPQFTLTCISTGGPATTVTWTRDSVTVTEGTETVLDDPVTAQYTHTLTVTGRLTGLYTCIVANSKPSEYSAELSVQVSDPVEDLKVVASSEDSLTFSWAPPTVSASLLTTAYSLTCSPQLEGIPPPQKTLSMESLATTATVTGLYSGVNYSCSVITVGIFGDSWPSNITHATLETAPGGAPEGFEAVPGQRQVVFSWSPPPVTQHNGVITNYTLSCSPSPSFLPLTIHAAPSGSLTVAGFDPDTHYSCSALATNSRGSGPSVNTSFTTQEDFSFFQLRLGGVVVCSEIISTGSERDEKLEDITEAVLVELGDTCSECAISGDIIIDEQVFACYSESPSFVTYRARIKGTSVIDSGSLVSLIEEWARSGDATIIVTRVLMVVDQDCSVAIPSLTVQEECAPLPTSTNSSTTSPSTDDSARQDSSSDNSTGIIIGGGASAVAIILIIAITVVVVSIVCLVIVRNRQKNTSRSVWRAEEHVMPELLGSTDMKDYSYVHMSGAACTKTHQLSSYGHIPTSTNTAYVSTRGRRRGGEEEDGYYEVIRAPFELQGPSLPHPPREYETPDHHDSRSQATDTAPPGYVNVRGEGCALRANEGEEEGGEGGGGDGNVGESETGGNLESVGEVEEGHGEGELSKEVVYEQIPADK